MSVNLFRLSLRVSKEEFFPYCFSCHLASSYPKPPAVISLRVKRLDFHLRCLIVSLASYHVASYYSLSYKHYSSIKCLVIYSVLQRSLEAYCRRCALAELSRCVRSHDPGVSFQRVLIRLRLSVSSSTLEL